MIVVRIPVRPVFAMVYWFVYNVGFFMHDSWLFSMLNVILSSFIVLLCLATGHLVLILALLVLKIALIFARCDMSYIQVEVLKFIVTVVLLVMFFGGLAIRFPLLVSAFVLQVLLIFAAITTIISMIMVYFRNYWCRTLMDDMVDGLADVRNLVNRS